MEWIFDGIGTAMVSFIVGNLFGGCIGYKIGISKKNFQKAGNNSIQIQNGDVINNQYNEQPDSKR